MNLYLLSLAVYALLITPITLELRVGCGDGLRYRLLVRVGGAPVFAQSLLIRERQDQLVLREKHILSKREKPKRLYRVKNDLHSWLPILARESVRRAIRRAVHLDALSFALHVDTDSAADTALWYAACNLVWQTALRVNPRLRVNGRVSAGFSEQRTQAAVMGIVRIHLGKILLVGLMALRAVQSSRKGKQAYAASH